MMKKGFLVTLLALCMTISVQAQVSAIFEIYKTKIEQYFTNSGRDWRTMYRAYVQQLKAKKK